MGSYKEQLALGRDPVRVRAVARRLLVSAEDWTEWERDFLEGLVAEYGSDALTTRQRQKLVELREGALFGDEPKSYTELSRITGIPVGAVGPTRARLLRQLRVEYERVDHASANLGLLSMPALAPLSESRHNEGVIDDDGIRRHQQSSRRGHGNATPDPAQEDRPSDQGRARSQGQGSSR